MKRYFWILLLSVCTFAHVFAQSDDCSTATPLSVTSTCTSPTSGTTTGATETIAGCVGNADDDVWYSFVATSTSHSITVTPSANMDPVVQLFSGSCSGLTSLSCVDNNFYPSGIETLNYSGLIIGTSYRIRVYHYGTGSGSGNFTICVTPGMPPPANDICSSATSIPVNTTCINTSGTLNGATESLPGCSGTADDDVWYSFVATAPSHTITTTTTDMIDLVFEVFSGNCGSLASIVCVDNNYTKGGTETANVVGLSIGTTYYVRVYDFYTNNTGDFSICITGAMGGVPNDEPCNAIILPTVTSACNYMEFSNVGATASTSAPTPSNCVGGSGTQIGGFSSSTADVWFEITVPSTGHINITNMPTVAGYIDDAVMALYSGTCGSLTQIACGDDFAYPPFPTSLNPSPSPNRFRPMINKTGLTPGTKIYLRYWGFGSKTGKFGFCVTTGVNDDCANALYICDLNGYSASTSASFTSDRPGNMHGNNESPTGASMTDGQNSGGPFGFYPSSNIAGAYSSPAIDVEIDNNSWIRFTAATTTVKLKVTIYDCFREAAGRSTGGIQMQIFDYTGCTSSSVFTPISEFKEGWGTFTIQTIDPLVVGQDYILMVDGYAGDICNYTISAESGVKFPEISPPAPVCSGSAVTLTAPPDGTSYLWLHDSTTTQSAVVNPSTTTTYSVQVEGLCGQRQTLSVEVKVKSPFVEVTAPSLTICSGETLVLTASAGATSYQWTDSTNTTIGTTQAITVSPNSTSDYTVKATMDDCQSSKTVTVTVTPPPIVTLTVAPKDSICSGDSITLTANGASSYTWDHGLPAGTSHTVSPTSTTVYKVIGKNGSCSDSTTQTITVVAPPTISGIAIVTPSACTSNTGAISGLSSSSLGVTYAWTNSANVVVGTTANISGIAPDTYTLTVTDAQGCMATSGMHTITSSSPPTVTLTSTTTSVCIGGTATLSAGGVSSYTWNNGLPMGATHSVSPTSTTTYTVTGTDSLGCVGSDSITIIVHPIPTALSITASSLGAMCVGDPPITLTASGATSYTWSTGATTVSISVSPPSTTMFYVNGVDANGCTASDSFSVVVNALPSISGGAMSVSPSNCDANTGTISGINISGTAPFLFSWTDASNTVVGTSKDISGLPTGTYTLEVMDSNTCINTFGPITISNPPTPSSPNVYATNTTLCEGDSATLSVMSTYTLGTTFVWTLPNGSLSSDIPLVIDNFSSADEGMYCLSASYLGCESIASCTGLSMQASPNVQIINSDLELTICQGAIASLTAMGANSYLWTGPNAFLWSGSTIQIAPFEIIHDGLYIVEGKDANGCTKKDSTWLSFVNNPVISLSTDASMGIYCQNTTAVISSTGATSYIWTTPSNETISGSSIIISDLNTTDVGWYVVIATDANNCTSIDSIHIQLSIPNMDFGLDDKIVVCPGEDVFFSTSIDLVSSYYWMGPNGYITDQHEFTLYETDMPDVGWYYLTVSDSIGCPQTDSIYLSVEPQASCLVIPDLITPDGDHHNDTWQIPYIHYFPNVEVEIYNRWGNLIFHSQHYQNEWRGQINRNKQTVLAQNGLVPTGTYFFVMTLNDPQKTPPIKGIIEVQY